MMIRSLRYKSSLDISTKIAKTVTNDNKFITHPLFKHPPYQEDHMKAIKFDHRDPTTIGDKTVYNIMKYSRVCFDFVTGYKKGHDFPGTRYEMTLGKWLTRCIFLESIAGVPGMTAAFIRHLHSIRLLKRDKAWIETLLDEAYNERMHLLTFIKLGQPSWFTKSIIYIGQGVFCNLFFFNYLFFPKLCHRFVGYLEEEAVSTYTHLLESLESNRLPELDKLVVPEVALNYYDMPKTSNFRDLVLRIRADEAKHREVNHTLGNLQQKDDRNPFALEVKDSKVQPMNTLENHKPKGWDRQDLIL